MMQHKYSFKVVDSVSMTKVDPTTIGECRRKIKPGIKIILQLNVIFYHSKVLFFIND